MKSIGETIIKSNAGKIADTYTPNQWYHSTKIINSQTTNVCYELSLLEEMLGIIEEISLSCIIFVSLKKYSIYFRCI